MTGTDGKTTTAHLVTDILQAAGWRVGLVSTVEVRLGKDMTPPEFLGAALKRRGVFLPEGSEGSAQAVEGTEGGRGLAAGAVSPA